jgi:predicted secreted protein
MNMSRNARHFRIWQQNVAKSSVVQHDVLANANPKDWDIIAIQEPYMDFLGLTRANPHWNVIYPSNKNQENQKRI